MANQLEMAISPQLAEERRARFGTLKKKYIGNKDAHIDLAPQSFIDFCNLISRIENSSGAWLYFGAYEQNGKYWLTVLVVPADASFKPVPGKYFTINAQYKFAPVSDSDAYKLITAFQKNLLPQLEQDMGGQKETKAIWYDKTGLIQLSQLLQTLGSQVVTVRTCFASYSETGSVSPSRVNPLQLSVKNQLTIVFTLIDKNGNKLGSAPKAKALDAATGNLGDPPPGDGGDYDTGVPCPPNDTCGLTPP